MKQIVKNMEANSEEVDVLLMMDCTSSMGKWIKSAQKCLISLTDEIMKIQGGQFKLRFAFVGYRDYDMKDMGMMYSTHDYSSDVTSV